MVPDRSIRICADRGGTFCDVHASYPDPENPEKRKELLVKLLSQDPGNYEDAPTEGVRRVLETVTGEKIPRKTVLDSSKIDYIRLSTTVATNALLERKGEKHALLITKGFKDLLLIGNQSRPKIFDLNIRRPSPLYSTVLEVDERVTLVGYTSDPTGESLKIDFHSNPDIVKGLSGEAVQVLQKPDPDAIRASLQDLYNQDYRSLAIVFIHSYTFPSHEQIVADIAASIGFKHISCSSSLMPMIKVLPRGTSATADAYLTPVLRAYLDGFFKGFDSSLRSSGRVEFMSSDGGLVDARGFNGLKSILSGPAGGVVGYALTSWDAKRGKPIIGIDIGGTSTDVSRYAGSYAITYETTTAGVSIQTPQLDINTVAAGGGSCLSFREGLVRAGPESAGADPGPMCYRKNGPLAVTDANLLLGRLIPDYFPKIFGPNEDQGLDIEASRSGFEDVWKQVRDYYEESKEERTLDDVVYGFIKVANETMCRPIRALTEAKGHATSEHILASFGGAGGQHACDIAKLLGIKKILIHRYSSILSAYGLALADRAHERQEPCSTPLTPELIDRLDALEESVRKELSEQGFSRPEQVSVERILNMRFDGTDTALMVSIPPSEERPDKTKQIERFEERFIELYKQEFGFILEEKKVVVDDVKVRGTGKTYDTLGPSVFEELETLQRKRISVPSEASSQNTKSTKINAFHSVYFEPPTGRYDKTPVFKLENLDVGDEILGPAIILDETQTVVVVPDAKVLVTSGHLVIELD
jgi:5-oxoprolinase (ATP-hydrolysing)